MIDTSTSVVIIGKKSKWIFAKHFRKLEYILNYACGCLGLVVIISCCWTHHLCVKLNFQIERNFSKFSIWFEWNYRKKHAVAVFAGLKYNDAVMRKSELKANKEYWNFGVKMTMHNGMFDKIFFTAPGIGERFQFIILKHDDRVS